MGAAHSTIDPVRRRLLTAALATSAGIATADEVILRRPVPSSGEQLPVIGMGTWLTFDIGHSAFDLARRRQVLEAFYARGGRVIDSSPMYGRAEAVLGELLSQLGSADRAFAATKVWTSGRDAGVRQMEDSLKLWGLSRFDLMQIHNMVDWEVHLPTLTQWKAQGRIRYLGLTTSHGRRHHAMEQALRRADFDFVQLTYSLAERGVERRLLPLAAERGIAVIVNRPFDGGALVDRLNASRLPAWAASIGCTCWAQVCLKWIVSHPAVTCAIPATTNPDHMRENMGALSGPLPDAALRHAIADHVARL
jgi:aryl-alcohol dehydrogenase-like predicted oxidoreductase